MLEGRPRPIRAYVCDAPFVEIGTPADYRRVHERLAARTASRRGPSPRRRGRPGGDFLARQSITLAQRLSSCTQSQNQLANFVGRQSVSTVQQLFRNNPADTCFIVSCAELASEPAHSLQVKFVPRGAGSWCRYLQRITLRFGIILIMHHSTTWSIVFRPDGNITPLVRFVNSPVESTVPSVIAVYRDVMETIFLDSDEVEIAYALTPQDKRP